MNYKIGIGRGEPSLRWSTWTIITAKSAEEAGAEALRLETEKQAVKPGGGKVKLKVETTVLLPACKACGSFNTRCEQIGSLHWEFASGEGMDKSLYGTFVLVCADCGHREEATCSSQGSTIVHCPFCSLGDALH